MVEIVSALLKKIVSDISLQWNIFLHAYLCIIKDFFDCQQMKSVSVLWMLFWNLWELSLIYKWIFDTCENIDEC